MDVKWLINLNLERDSIRLIFKTEGGRLELLDQYFPYFYVICDNPDELCYQISQHPSVIDAKVEGKYQKVESMERAPTVKVTTSRKDFKQVVGDVKKVPGVKELAETSIPHYFRYIADRNLQFFAPHKVNRHGSGYIFEKEQDGELPELSMAAIAPNDNIPEGVDVAYTYGGDNFLRGRKGIISNSLGCFSKDFIHIDLNQDIAHDIYNQPSTKDLMELGKERLIRVIELSSISGAKPDLVPRITPGKLNSYIHMEVARRRGFLVPDIKKPIERPKSLRLLQIMDKGGTIFYPRPGVYKDVAKCDFASLYPSIIVKFNISPETIHCECGNYVEVPEAGWRICKRRGLIPDGLERVLKRRLELKKLMKASSGEERKKYKIQQRALKNILVCAYGYMGYNNFVFANVENKESVVLFGRHIIERTKEIAEECGLEVIYGIVDSVFVKNGNEQQYNEFARRVSEEIGIELEIDCLFRSIIFPSSRHGAGVANKYYGIKYDGEIEARGISLRHSDAPDFIKEFEKEAIRAIMENERAKLETIYRYYQSGVIEKKFPLESFAITKSVRKGGYKVEVAHFIAYKQDPSGIDEVTYVYTKYGPRPLSMAKISELDEKEYIRLLKRSRSELLMGVEDQRSSARIVRL